MNLLAGIEICVANCNIKITGATHNIEKLFFSGELTSETQPCGQAVVYLLHMQVKSSVKFPACFLSFPLQVCHKLTHPNVCGHIQLSELGIEKSCLGIFRDLL